MNPLNRIKIRMRVFHREFFLFPTLLQNKVSFIINSNFKSFRFILEVLHVYQPVFRKMSIWGVPL